jgi:hypothetical protein
MLVDGALAPWVECYKTPSRQIPAHEKVLPLDGPAADGLSEEELLKKAVRSVGSGSTAFQGLMRGTDGQVVVLWSEPFG